MLSLLRFISYVSCLFSLFTGTYTNGTATSQNQPVVPPSTSASNSTSATSVITGAGRRLEPGEIPVTKSSVNKSSANVNKNMLDAAMLQLLATQMMSQQAAVAKMNGHSVHHKTTAKKDAAQLVLDLSAKTKTEPGPSSDGTDTRSSATPSECIGEVGKKRPPATESQARVPLTLGWRRQTCIRSIAASGVRGDVVYYAPCGKKLSTYAEVLRYLMKHPCGPISRDNFSFSSKLIVGEFLMPREAENGDKVVIKMSEDVIAEEVNRLVSLKSHSRNGERKYRERSEKPQEKIQEEKNTPEETQEQHDHVEVEESPLEVYDDEDKVKWSREPIDDLLLTEIRPMPDLPRVENLRLDGNGFADALMVHEFVHNFAHVLELDLSTLPSLGALCSGLVGDANHFEKVLQLTISLFRLSLEYPGLPTGKSGRTRLGQTISETGVTKENYSELLRFFLATRDSQGQKLSELLNGRTFAELPGEEKASILAFLCNELLCCPNIVKEIERNLEEVGRLKGDRWMRDGKARALRVVQRRKQKAERGPHSSESESHTHDERPPSRNSEASDTSRPATPIQTTKDRRLTPGLGQCEILTEEEENMSPEQLDILIDSLNAEAEHLKEKINELSTKVRSFPLGWDRYHRQYWQVRGVASILVESIESSGPSNPACNVEETCTKDPPNLT
ncbi:Methyl-CpG binding domain protein, partial [Necator americanus]